MPGDFQENFVYITQLFQYYNVFVVPPDSPFQTMEDLISAANAQPGAIAVGMVQIGGIGWMMVRKLVSGAAIKLNEIVYQTTAQRITDLLGGRLAVGTALVGDAAPHIKSGRLRALGVSAPNPVVQLPDVPPIANTVPGFEMSSWFGLAVMKGTSADLIDEYEKHAIAAVNSPAVRDRLIQGGLQPVGSNRTEFASFLDKERAMYQQVFKESNIQRNE